MHAATSKVENSAQGLSCKLKFVHGMAQSHRIEIELCAQSMSQYKVTAAIAVIIILTKSISLV